MGFVLGNSHRRASPASPLPADPTARTHGALSVKSALLLAQFEANALLFVDKEKLTQFSCPFWEADSKGPLHACGYILPAPVLSMAGPYVLLLN